MRKTATHSQMLWDWMAEFLWRSRKSKAYKTEKDTNVSASIYVFIYMGNPMYLLGCIWQMWGQLPVSQSVCRSDGRSACCQLVLLYVFLLWLHLTVRQPEKLFAWQRPGWGRQRGRDKAREMCELWTLVYIFWVAFSIAITQNESQQLNFGRQTDRRTVRQNDIEIVQRVPDNLLEILSYMGFSFFLSFYSFVFSKYRETLAVC